MNTLIGKVAEGCNVKFLFAINGPNSVPACIKFNAKTESVSSASFFTSSMSGRDNLALEITSLSET